MLVDVGMAVGATVTHVGEHRLDVTLGAGNALVHATQGIAGLAVIKLRKVANWRPSAIGVAVLAGDIQISVGAMGGRSRGLRLRTFGSARKKRKQRQDQIDVKH